MQSDTVFTTLTTNSQLAFNIDMVQALKFAVAKRKHAPAINPIGLAWSTPTSHIEHLTTESSSSLVSVKAVFPFALFPDTINIDREKLTIIHTEFFRSSDVISLHIEDIQSVQSKVGPFFGTLILSSKFFINSVQTVNFLRRADAIRLQRFIQGCMIARQKGIDCSNIEKNQLIPLLTGLGLGATN